MSRAVRIRLWVFLVIGGIAVVNAGARYAGLTDALFPTTYTVSVQLERSGGLFERGEVTYRGFTVGRVQDLEFRTDGVTAVLAIKKKWKIPATDLTAAVHNRSAVGEQYVDLVPRTDDGPFLVDGSVIGEEASSTPVEDQELIVATDRLLRSIDTEDLRTVVDESAAAFSGAGDDLGRLLSSSENILAEARDALPATRTLLRTGEVVLGTQNAQAATIGALLDDLVQVTGVFASRDTAVRRVFADGTLAAGQLGLLFESLDPALTRFLDPMRTLAAIAAPQRDGLEETLVAIPWALASAQTPGRDKRAHFTFVGGASPTPCRRGYLPAEQWKSIHDPVPSVLPEDIGCREPASVPRGVTR